MNLGPYIGKHLANKIICLVYLFIWLLYTNCRKKRGTKIVQNHCICVYVWMYACMHACIVHDHRHISHHSLLFISRLLAGPLHYIYPFTHCVFNSHPAYKNGKFLKFYIQSISYVVLEIWMEGLNMIKIYCMKFSKM